MGSAEILTNEKWQKVVEIDTIAFSSKRHKNRNFQISEIPQKEFYTSL